MSANLLFFYQKKTFYELFLIKKTTKRINDFTNIYFLLKKQGKKTDCYLRICIAAFLVSTLFITRSTTPSAITNVERMMPI